MSRGLEALDRLESLRFEAYTESIDQGALWDAVMDTVREIHRRIDVLEDRLDGPSGDEE